jgi:hypothetical protein
MPPSGGILHFRPVRSAGTSMMIACNHSPTNKHEIPMAALPSSRAILIVAANH